MATLVHRGPEGIIYRAAETREVPAMDILTVLFGKSLHPYPSIHIEVTEAFVYA